jgi:hypothetical protein
MIYGMVRVLMRLEFHLKLLLKEIGKKVYYMVKLKLSIEIKINLWECLEMVKNMGKELYIMETDQNLKDNLTTISQMGEEKSSMIVHIPRDLLHTKETLKMV